MELFKELLKSANEARSEEETLSTSNESSSDSSDTCSDVSTFSTSSKRKKLYQAKQAKMRKTAADKRYEVLTSKKKLNKNLDFSGDIYTEAEDFPELPKPHSGTGPLPGKTKMSNARRPGTGALPGQSENTAGRFVASAFPGQSKAGSTEAGAFPGPSSNTDGCPITSAFPGNDVPTGTGAFPGHDVGDQQMNNAAAAERRGSSNDKGWSTINYEEQISKLQLAYNKLLSRFNELSKKNSPSPQKIVKKSKNISRKNLKPEDSRKPKQVIPVQENRFAPLSEDENVELMEDNGTESESEGTTINPKEKTPPPIVAYNLILKDFSIRLNRKLGNANYLFRKINRNVVHILLKTKNDYNQTLALLKEENISFYTYTPRDEKPVSVVLRDLHPSYDENDIRDGLLSLQLNIDITRISILHHKKGDSPIWLVQIKQGFNLRNLLSTRYLLGQSVKIEKFHPSAMIQCRNCQRFGHIASKCSMRYRCVKCKDEHPYGKCPKPPKDSEQNKTFIRIVENPDGTIGKEYGAIPECINCGKAGHTANYKKCEKYLELLERKRARIEQIREKGKYYSNFVQNNISYASHLRNTDQFYTQPRIADKSLNNPRVGNSNGIKFLNDECNLVFGLNLFDCLKKVDNFLPSYKELTDINEKRLALLSFMTELTVNSQI